MTSKHNKIRKHLLSGRSISGLSALGKFNIYRLASIINRLRNEGLNIETVKTGNNGYAVYHLKK